MQGLSLGTKKVPTKWPRRAIFTILQSEFTITNRLYSTWLFVAVGSNTKAIGECLKYVNDSHSTKKYRKTARAFVISESTFRKSCKMEYPYGAIRGNKTWITGFKALKENKKGGGIPMKFPCCYMRRNSWIVIRDERPPFTHIIQCYYQFR